MNYVIATSREIYEKIAHNLSSVIDGNLYLINNKEQLSYGCLKELNPKYIFFPHWSHLIPESVYQNYNCVIFHMTDLPFGRGGSPMQNLIARGIYETKITAIKCVKEIDEGPVFLKRPFSLYGDAEEIMIRASDLIEEMIIDIINTNPIPVSQEGEAVYFQRRNPEDGNIGNLKELKQVFDYIRMLDADGYPRAFIESNSLRFEFKRASQKKGYLLADVKITKKRVNNE